MDIIHVGLVSCGSWNFIFLDEIGVDMAASAGSGKVEGIDPGLRIALSANIMAALAILASGRLALPQLLRNPVNAPLIGLVWMGMAGCTTGRRKMAFGLNIVSSMAIGAKGNGSMNTFPQGLL